MMEGVQATISPRATKRKADGQDNNDRLSKRLSLLNLERNGQKLYVPVEQATNRLPRKEYKPPRENEMMDMDDSKHKVYIYDLDAELSDSESDDGKLVFLPDVEKHLRATRIPPSILANSEGELAGCNQLILYNVPSSLTVPEEKDSVRKAIIETRARARAKQEENQLAEVRDTLAFDTTSKTEGRKWFREQGMRGPMTRSERFSFVPSSSFQHGSHGDDADAMDLG